MQLAYNFNFSLHHVVFLLILWIFGISMIAMAVLICVPARWLAALSVAVILFHNLLDGMQASQFGSGRMGLEPAASAGLLSRLRARR